MLTPLFRSEILIILCIYIEETLFEVKKYRSIFIYQFLFNFEKGRIVYDYNIQLIYFAINF